MYETKIIQSGEGILEIFRYEKPVFYGFQAKRGHALDYLDPDIDAIEDGLGQRRGDNIIRARNSFRRLINSNFNEHSKFVTLTYKENVTDLDKANTDYKKFIQRMRYKYQDFKYATVIEFQKRGAVHYHMMSNLPYIPNKALKEIWGHGFVRINDISKVDNVGAYMVKYMTKDLSDSRLVGRKAFLTSKNLDRPRIIVGAEAIQLIQRYGLEQKKEVFANSYISEHHGTVTYTEYNLKRTVLSPDRLQQTTV